VLHSISDFVDIVFHFMEKSKLRLSRCSRYEVEADNDESSAISEAELIAKRYIGLKLESN
jgi:hypothetical protein